MVTYGKPATEQSSSFLNRYGWVLLILLLAAFLRWHLLPQLPPGMTHDEADHGLSAWSVVQGERPIYFAIANGREPLFDYSTTILMRFLGATYLAGRLTATYFGLLLIAGSYAFCRRAFNQQVALLTTAGLALSFWGVMSSRQALRSVTMPALYTVAAFFYWRYVTNRKWGDIVIAGILLGISFYTYLPARIMWGVYAGILLVWGLFNRPKLRQNWRATLLMLGMAGLISLPLFNYLRTHPDVETRISQLTDALESAQQGDFAPLWQNSVAGLRLITVSGDTQWRYNIAGKPILGTIMGWLFYIGLMVAIIHIVQHKFRGEEADSTIFTLGWLIAGISPALITGAEDATQRTIAMQPILYLFPAIALWQANRFLKEKWQHFGWLLVVMILFGWTANQTYQDYFWNWGQHPQVRVQYESTLTETIRQLNQQDGGAVAISTPTPNLYHSPSVGLMMQSNPQLSLRWFNGAHSLLLPHENRATITFSGFAELNPLLAPFFAPTTPPVVLPMRSTDLDKPVQLFQLETLPLREQWTAQITPVSAGNLDGVVTLQGYKLLTPELPAGRIAQIATIWQIERAETDLVLFTHLPNPAGGDPLAQADRLDVPSDFWVAGDWFVQLHQFQLPAEMAAGDYPLVVGAYHRSDGRRLPPLMSNSSIEDIIPVGNITVR